MKIVGNLVLPDRILYGGEITLESGRIAEIKPGEKPENGAILPYVLPGLVDIHNHGAEGFDYMDASPEAFEAISRHLLKCGVTTAQCTTVSAPVEKILSFLRFFRSWRKEHAGDRTHCRFCGVHLEGPYLSKERRGAHPLEALQTSADGYEWVLENSDVVREITVAPELDGSGQMIAAFRRAGITVSGGHDDAEIEDVERAVRNGMSHCTHLYCAMSSLHKTGSERRCGLTEYAMTHREITAEIIADNHHIPPLLAQMIYSCKGADGLCIVSDAISPAGLPESGELYTLGSEGDHATRVFVENGVALVEDKSCYAGSVQALDQMISNLVKDANIPLVDAVRMATLTPASVIGIEGDCGSLKVGKRADLCLMDAGLNVVKTMVEGETVYERDR